LLTFLKKKSIGSYNPIGSEIERPIEQPCMYLVTVADVANILERKGSYMKETLTIRGDIGYYFVKKPYGLDRENQLFFE